MRAKENNLYRLLGGGDASFVIPVFQRNYDWQIEQCEKLIVDIKNICNTRKRHFIGTICYKEHQNRELSIIDGQQRITSIMLLVKALHDITDDEKLKNYLFNQILMNQYSYDSKPKIKLKPIKKDESVYRKLIYQSNFDEDAFDKTEKKSNIFKNYMLFKNKLIEMKNEGYEDTKIRDAIEQLEIVELEIEDENPQVVFESLNSTGLDLTKSDLIRNYVLMPLEYKFQEEMYNKYWLPIEQIFDSPKDVETFITYYLIYKRGSDSVTINNKKSKITKKNVYTIFKKEYSTLQTQNREEIETFFEDILKYANYYRNFIFSDDAIMPTNNTIQNKLFVLFNIIKKDSVSIFLFFIYDCLNKGIINESLLPQILDILISFSIRGLVCKKTGFSVQYAILSVQKLEKDIETNNNFIDCLYKVLNNGSGSYAFPKNTEFKNCLLNSEIYISMKNSCKYLLHEIEKYYNPNELIAYEEGTIEHICPQTLTKELKEYLNAKDDLMSYEQYKHTLGNLTLTGYNSKLSNNLFSKKREEYSHSNYTITKNIAENEDWTTIEVKQRGQELASIALKIWPLPEEYNKMQKIDTGVTYDMNSDFNLFTGKKPNELTFLDKTIITSSWRDLLKYTMEILYQYDVDTFEELIEYFADKKDLFATTQKQDFTEISNTNYFVNTRNSAYATLDIIKRSLTFFDEKLETEITEDFSFTIKKNENDYTEENNILSNINNEKKEVVNKPILINAFITTEDGELIPNILKNDIVFHKKFGEGTVLCIEEKIIKIKFGKDIRTLIFPDFVFNGVIQKISN